MTTIRTHRRVRTLVRLPLLAGIGARLLLARPRRFVVTLLGASLCVAVALSALSTLGGLRAAYTGRLLEVGAHLTVKATDVRGRRSDLLLDVGTRTGAVELGRTAERADRIRLRNVMTVLRSIERILGERIAVASPYLSTVVLATYGTNEGVLQLKGVIPEREARLAELDEVLAAGSIKRLEATRFGVLLGARAAREIGAGRGDRIRIVSMTGDIFNVEVVDVYDIGLDAANRGGLVNLRLAQAIEHTLPSEATAIALQLRRPSEADAVAHRIEKVSRREVETWEETYPDALSPYRALRIVLFTVAGMAMALAGLAIASATIASAHEDCPTVAALRSMGAGRGDVLLAYLTQGLITAAAAALVGSLLGVVAMAVLAALPADGVRGLLLAEHATLPVEWSPRWFLIVGAATMLAGFLGALYPARTAAHRRAAAVLDEAEV